MFQKIVLSVKKYVRDESAVSVIFGALLLLSLLSVLFSVFLVTALPAWTQYREAEESDLLYADVLKFSENAGPLSRSDVSGSSFPKNQILSSRQSTAMVDENSGFLLFWAEINVPPEVESLLKMGTNLSPNPGSNPGPNSGPNSGQNPGPNSGQNPGQNPSSNSVYFKLSSGSVHFINSYTQIPDQFYFCGPAGLILCQEDGASFIRPLPIYLSRGDGGKILLQLSGYIVEGRSSAVSGANSVICFRNVQTVYAHDFVSEVEIRYVPPAALNVGLDEIFYENRDIAVETYLSNFAALVSDNYPEIEAVYKDEIVCLTLTSEKPIEIDIQVTVLQIEFE